MSDPYMLRVEKAICSHIEDRIAASTTRPAEWEDPVKVFRGRGYIGGRGSREPLPALSLIMAPEVEPETIQAGNGRERTREVLYFIQGWCEVGEPDAETDPAHFLMAETIKSLADVMFPDDRENPNYMLRFASGNSTLFIESLQLGFGIVRPPEEGISPTAAYFWLPIKIGLIQTPADPYALPNP